MEDLQFDTITSLQRREAYAEITFDLEPGKNATLKGKVDTGASDSILPLRTFRKMYPSSVSADGNPVGLEPSTVRLSAYNGSPIQHYGTITLQCSYRDSERVTARFFVCDCSGPVIFGLPLCMSVGLVQLNCSIHVTTAPEANNPTQTLSKDTQVPLVHPTTLDTLRNMHPTLFTGIGKFPGTYKLTLRTGASPVIHAPRRAPVHLQGKIREELQKMVTLDVIRPVEEPTDWVSSLTYTVKDDQSIRVCLDPTDLNRALKRGQHHIPTIEEVTHKLAGATVFSKLDAKSGYWAVQLNEDSQLLTTFNSPVGRFCFKRLPFGLCVSQDVYQSAMDDILRDLPGVVSIADDIIVFGSSREEHDNNLRCLMERANERGLVFNPVKCHINVPEVQFFGNIYGKDGVRPDPAKVQAINDFAPPKSEKDLQTFLGMVTYLSSYIPNLSEHTAVLRGLLRKDSEFQWCLEHESAFRKLQTLICDATQLVYFDPKKDTTVQVDASQHALGAALLQDDKVVAFASKSLSEVEKRYANIERELLACVFGAERFHTYLYGKSFTILSDHKPLEMIARKNLASAPARLQRMLLRLQRYDYQLEYRPGKDMTLPDSLSRHPINQAHPHVDLDVQVCFVQFSQSRLSELREATATDQALSELMRYTVSGFPERIRDLPRTLHQYWSYRDEISAENGILLKGERVIIPSSLRSYYLGKVHEGHQGITKSQQRAKMCIFWPGINQDIEVLVSGCTPCQTYQASQSPLPIMPMVANMPQVPWNTVSTDLFTLDGQDYLIIVDYYSRYPIVECLKKNTTSSTVTDICSRTFAMFGIPKTLISDNGPQFTAKPFQQLMCKMDIQHITSSPHHPRSHGLVERAIRTVKGCMRKCHTDTDLALLSLRTTPLDARTPSPAELLFGRKIGCQLPTYSTANEPMSRMEIRCRRTVGTSRPVGRSSYILPRRCQKDMAPCDCNWNWS